MFGVGYPGFDPLEDFFRCYLADGMTVAQTPQPVSETTHITFW